MDIIQYSKEHDAFRKDLRAFCEKEINPFVDQWETDHIVPKEIWRKVGRAGFLCPDVAPEYGGRGGNFLDALIIAEEMSRTWHTGLATALHSDVVVPYISTFGSEELKQTYLPGCVNGDIITAIAMTEPDAGSDLASLGTTAVEEGDTVVLNGSKTFISNGINCDLVIVAARDPEEENSYQALSLYIVEDGTPGFSRGKHLEKMGWWSQDTAELFFSNCRIPVANRIGDKGTGFLMLMQKLQQERLACAVGAVVGAERALEWITDYCTTTQVAGKPISKSQAVQFALVEMATEVKIGRTFLDKLVADHVEGLEIIVETSMAKYWTTEMVRRVADRSLDLMGEYGNLEQSPLVRGFRDVRVMSIFAGTNEIMKGIAAKFMGL
jgi:alkylation response protein AidB-like acyl-CoA dehydrogenase